MHPKRPKHLNLMQIRLPLPGVLSILHRVSGAGLFLIIPVLLYVLQVSLSSPEAFERYRACFTSWPAKVFLLGITWAYAHHFCAGIRHLLMDVHVGVELKGARTSTYIAFAVSLLVTALVGGLLIW